MADMKSKFTRLFFLLCLSLSTVFAQDPDLKETFLEAESYFLFEEYNEALPLYLRLHRADRNNDDINYKIGICFLNDPYQKEKSIRYLEIASKNVNPKYKENNFKETTAPLEVFYYLGNAYLVNNQIDKALENYKHFLDILDPDIYDIELVKAQIRTCERAKELQKKEVDFDLVNLGEKINGRFADINPVLSGDGKTLVYVSQRQFYDATFYSQKVDGEWQTPRNIIPELGVDGDVYPTGLSFDGKTMIIYRNDDFIGNLYVSNLIDGRWSEMRKLGDNINTKYWESHGSLSKDGNVLYFTSNRKGGFGGLDIYKSFKQPDGTWGEPVNLGAKINSRYNEETPFVLEDGHLLYFSSYGHYNIGGYDIFYSKLNDQGVWGVPVNLGYPINTTDDDLFFLPRNSGNSGLISKFTDDGYGRHDIFQTEIYSENNPRMYLISGTFDSEDSLITRDEDMKIHVINTLTGDTVLITQPDLDLQAFEFKVPKGDFNIIINSRSYKQLENKVVIDSSTNKDGVDLSEKLKLELKPYKPKIYTGEDSRIELNKDTLVDLNPGEEHTARLRLQRKSRLYVDMYYDTILVASDTFEISRRRFKYDFVPGGEKTVLEFKMEEENGDISKSRLIAIPADLEDEDLNYKDSLKEADTMAVDAIKDIDTVTEDRMDTDIAEPIVQESEYSEDYRAVDEILADFSRYADEELRYILNTIDPERDNIKSRIELREFLINERGVQQSDLDAIEIYSVLDNDAERLLMYMIDRSSGDMKVYLENLDLKEVGIDSASELVAHLKQVAGNQGFTPEDVIDAVALVKHGQLSAERARKEFLSVADGELRDYLRQIDMDQRSIHSGEDLINHLRSVSGQESFTTKEVESLIIKQNLSGIQATDLLGDYIELSQGELKEYLKYIDLEALGIESAVDLVNHLMELAGEGAFSLDEINQLVSTEMVVGLSASETRDYLLSVGSEGLIEYLNTLDLEEEGLYTSAALIDHLRKAAGKEPFSIVEIENLVADQLVNELSSEELKEFLMQTGNEALVNYLEQLDMDKRSINSAAELTFHLRKAARLELFDSEEIRHLSMALKFRDLTADQLKKDFVEIAEGDLKNYLINLDLERAGISSGIELVKHLIAVSGKEGFSQSEINDLLTNVIIKDLSLDEAHEMLLSTSSGNLKTYLEALNPRAAKINSSVELMNHLRKVSSDQGFDSDEVNRLAVMGDIYNMDSSDALNSLINIADGDLKIFLENLDIEDKGIDNGAELVNYLVKISQKQPFSIADINKLITNIHQKEISADRALFLMEDRSEGRLKDFLNNLNLLRNDINSKGDLIEFLISRSGEDFSDEELYNALPSLFAEPKNVSTFINFLVNSSSGRLADYLEGLDIEAEGIESISELFDYLINHADEIGMDEDQIRSFIIERSGVFLSNPLEGIESISAVKSQFNIWQLLLAVAATGMLFYIILFYRRKDEDD